jgi:hypothetical protein
LTSMKQRTRVVLAAGAAATAMTMLAAGGAVAVDPPTWKAGYVPSGPDCIPLVGGPVVPTPVTNVYLDMQRPTFESVTPNVVRLGNAPQAASLWKLRVKQTCGGTMGLIAFVDRGDGTSHVWEIMNAPADGNYFDTTYDLRTDTSDEAGLKFDHDDLGGYALHSAMALNRFSFFELNANRTEVVDGDSGISEFTINGVSGAGRDKSYVLRDTTAAATTASKKKVKKGKKVTVSTSFKVANGSAYVGLSGQQVKLERRYKGSEKWVAVKTGSTTSAGTVTFKDKPKKTATYRVVNAGTFAAPWTAPSTSSDVKVKVKKVKKADKKKGQKKSGKKKSD